jgi:hypothetical protein
VPAGAWGAGVTRASRVGRPQEGAQNVSVQARVEVVGCVVDLVHVLSPHIPQEGAQSPFAGSAGGAQPLFEGVAVLGEGVQGSEGNEGVPDVRAPEPGAGGGGDCPGGNGAQVAKFRVEYC